MATTNLGGRVTKRLNRPTGFFTTVDVKAGEAPIVGTLGLQQSGLLVDATGNIGAGGTPVMVDRAETPMERTAETPLDNRTGQDGDVRARVIHGEAFLLNVQDNISATNEGDDVFIVDNDTVTITQVGTEPKVGHIVRVEGQNSAYVLVEGTA